MVHFSCPISMGVGREIHHLFKCYKTGASLDRYKARERRNLWDSRITASVRCQNTNRPMDLMEEQRSLVGGGRQYKTGR